MTVCFTVESDEIEKREEREKEREKREERRDRERLREGTVPDERKSVTESEKNTIAFTIIIYGYVMDQ